MPAIDVPNGRIAYEIAGTGDPVLFISGLNGHGAFWRRQLEKMPDRFTTVSFDHRGVGGSAGEPPYSVEQWAEDAVRLLDTLGFSRAHLVGHSTGGLIAQVLASNHPSRVISVVLSGTWAFPDERLKAVFRIRCETLNALGVSAHRQLGKILTTPADEPWPAAHASDREPSSSVILARMKALLAYEAGERLSRIDCPTLVIAAQDDFLIPARMSRQLAGRIPGARYVLFAGGGHLFPDSRSDEYNRVLLDFLASSAGKTKAEAPLFGDEHGQ